MDYYLVYILNSHFYIFLSFLIGLTPFLFNSRAGDYFAFRWALLFFISFNLFLISFQFNYKLKVEEISSMIDNGVIDKSVLSRVVDNMYRDLEMSDFVDYNKIEDGEVTYVKIINAIDDINRDSFKTSEDYTSKFIEAREKSLDKIYKLEDLLY